MKKDLILILVRHTPSKQTNKYITHPGIDFKKKKHKVHENVSVDRLFYILKKTTVCCLQHSFAIKPKETVDS